MCADGRRLGARLTFCAWFALGLETADGAEDDDDGAEADQNDLGRSVSHGRAPFVKMGTAILRRGKLRGAVRPLFAEEHLQTGEQVLVSDRHGVEAQRAEGELHDGTRAEGADQRADAHGAAEKVAYGRHGREHQYAHQADGKLFQALLEPHEQGVARAAAERGHHIGRLRVADDEQAEYRDDDAAGYGARRWDDVEPVEKVDGLADQHGVDEHGQADGLLQKYVNEQYRHRDDDGRRAVEDAERVGQAETEHVPGGRADARADGQVDAEAVDEQRHRRQQDVQKDRTAGGVVAEFQ